MNYAVATHFDEAQKHGCFVQGAITLTPTSGGGLGIEADLTGDAAAAFRFESRAAASIFAGRLTDLCAAMPGWERTWFVVELAEPRR